MTSGEPIFGGTFTLVSEPRLNAQPRQTPTIDGQTISNVISKLNHVSSIRGNQSSAPVVTNFPESQLLSFPNLVLITKVYESFFILLNYPLLLYTSNI